MADKKISAMTAYTTIAAGDYVPIVDISESADADKNKRALLSTLNIPVFLTTAGTSASWGGTALSTTGKTVIDLSAFSGSIPENISAVLVSLGARDSESGTVSTWIGLSPNDSAGVLAVTNMLTGMANDVVQTVNGICPCNSDGDIYYQCQASGTATLDAWLSIWGYWL